MKKRTFLSMIMALALAGAAFAQPVEVGNAVCPVSGEKVGEMGQVVKHEYNGKIYNLCCAMCAKDFKKDPEKYVKIVEEAMKQHEESGAEHGGHRHDEH
jgi:YHS domain-containing protein